MSWVCPLLWFIWANDPVVEARKPKRVPLLCTFLHQQSKHAAASTAGEIPPSGWRWWWEASFLLDVMEKMRISKDTTFFFLKEQDPIFFSMHSWSAHGLQRIYLSKLTFLFYSRTQPEAVLTHELQTGETFPHSQQGPLHGHFSHQQVAFGITTWKKRCKNQNCQLVPHRSHHVSAAPPQSFGLAKFYFYLSPRLPALPSSPHKKNGASSTSAKRLLLGWHCSELPVHWLFRVHSQRRALSPGKLGCTRGGSREA